MRWIARLLSGQKKSRHSIKLYFEELEDRRVMTSFTTLQLHEASQYVLEAINRARANPAAEAARYGIDLNEGLAPGTISTAPKQPLAPNPALISAIEGHLSVWLGSTAYWQADGGAGAPNPHTGLGDGNPGDRIVAAGYTNWSWWGENLATRWQTNAVSDLQAMADQLEQDLFVDSGVGGRGHRLNILEPNFQEAGVGLLSDLKPAGSLTGSNLVLLGQDFASSFDSGSIISGVVYHDANTNSRYDIGEALSGGIRVSWSNGSATGSATIADAGGFSTGKLASGVWTITISGGPLASPMSQTVTLGSVNAKVDFLVPDSNLGPPAPPAWPSGFDYDTNTHVLTVTASASSAGNSFGFSQASGTDTLTLNGTAVSVAESLLAAVHVNFAGNNNAAMLDTSGELAAQVVRIGNDGGKIQSLDSVGNATDFVTLSGFASVFATVNHADQGFIDGTPGVKNVFVGAGGYAYMNTGNQAERFYYLKGARFVYSYALSDLDYCYQYDGSGPSAYTVSGTSYCLMLGTDHGQSFYNEGVGFVFNEGIAQHPSQDVAYFYDSAGNDAFTAFGQYASMTSADGKFKENDIAAYFTQVYAWSFVGGTDTAAIYDATVNHATGFRRVV